MKTLIKKSTLITFFVLISSLVSAQQGLSIQGKKVKDGVIYLTFDGQRLEYFTPNKPADGKKNVNESITFSLKDDNSCNIYLKWINPLKYQLSWKDTTYIDERNKAISDFIDLLVAQYGSPVALLNKKENTELAEASTKVAIHINSQIGFNDLVFNNTDLTLLYIMLRSYDGTISPEFRAVTDSIKKIDSLMAINVSEKVDLIFSDLLKLQDYSKVLTTVASKEVELTAIEKLFSEINNLQEFIEVKVSKLTIADDALYNNYSKSIITKFIEESKNKLSSDKKLTNKLKPVIEVIKKSINNESLNVATKGFFKVRSVTFEDGKKLRTTFTINEYEFRKETKEFLKKSEVLKKSLTFQKYDFFSISVSTGLFYSNTTLKGYGVSNNSNNDFIIIEDDITKSSPVTAVFLNFNFGIGSRYFAPLTQIGIDPTKKRPFLLLGGGFSIPSARIAFTGGPIWTWNQSLDKLSVGEIISSTTDLEQDIKYEFDVEPKGWYLGIQYNL